MGDCVKVFTEVQIDSQQLLSLVSHVYEPQLSSLLSPPCPVTLMFSRAPAPVSLKHHLVEQPLGSTAGVLRRTRVRGHPGAGGTLQGHMQFLFSSSPFPSGGC